jgi:putative addiction module CopG family antidote
MSSKTTLTVRLNPALSDYVAGNVGENGNYENVSEYVRDLIRRDKARSEQDAFERLKAELRLAFEQPEDSFETLTAREVIQRNRPSK